MENIFVSVIVPVYNVEDYVEECIESILTQSFSNFELILVDDGSTDNSGEICNKWEKDLKIRVIHKENGGLVSAWRTGVLNAKYDWICFVDSDDWIEKEHLKQLAVEQKATGADVVVTRMKQVYGNGSQEYIDIIAKPKSYKGFDLENELYPILLNAGGFEKRGIPISRCSKLIRKALIIDNLKYCNNKTTYEEDLNIIFPVLLDANCISVIKTEQGAYCYRWTENSMLHSYDRKMEESIRHVYPSIIKACEDKSKKIFLSQIYQEYLTAMIRNVTNELKNPGGFRLIEENIKQISQDRLLNKCISEINYNEFPIKFKIVVAILKHYNYFNRKILLKALYIARKII